MSLLGGAVSACKTANISDQPLNAWSRPSPSHTSPLIGCPPQLITSSRKTTRPVPFILRIFGGPAPDRISVHTTAFRGVGVGVVFPQTELGGDAGAVRAYAQRAEELGFTHVLAYDHVAGADPAVHKGWDGPYDVQTTCRWSCTATWPR